MNNERRYTREIDAAEEAKLAAYVALQSRWMAIAFKIGTIGVCIEYVVIRSVYGPWPTLATFFLVSEVPNKPLFFCGFFCAVTFVLIGFAVNAYKERLGYLRDSDRIPPMGRPHQRKLWWAILFVACNELTGLVFIMFR